MKKGCVVTSPYYQNNALFDLDDKIKNRDNCLLCFYLIKKLFREKGISLSTDDLIPVEKADFVIYNDMPKVLPEYNAIPKSYLLLFENELIQPENYNVKKHFYFNKIFTWDNRLDNPEKYIEVRYPQYLPKVKAEALQPTNKKLCTLIASNKSSHDPRELYSERRRAIRWFENNHPDDFDLYGIGWTQRTFIRPFGRLNKFSFMRRMWYRPYSSYRGPIESKYDILAKYKFAICYENSRAFPGYITEKIFDCFFSLCIPIYLGAPNINDYIPEELYIDKNAFPTYTLLYEFISTMTSSEYKTIIERIYNFTASQNILLFSAERFAEKIVQNIDI